MKKILLVLMFLSSVSWAQGDVSLPICQRPSICGPIPAGQLDKTVTTQGNTFNGASELVRLLGNGKLPALDASNLFNVPGGGGSSTGTPNTIAYYDGSGNLTSSGNLTFDGTTVAASIFSGLSGSGPITLRTEDKLGVPGNVLIKGGDTIQGGQSSDITIWAGDTDIANTHGGSGPSGTILLRGGTEKTSDHAYIQITGASQLPPGHAGDIFIKAGNPNGGGSPHTAGVINLEAGTGASINLNSNAIALSMDVTGNINSINTVPYVWPVAQGGAGFALVNDGSGNLSWSAVTSPVGGADTQLLYNSAGVETGSPAMTYNGTTLLLATDGTWHDTSNATILTIDGSGFLMTGPAFTLTDTANGILAMNGGVFHYVDGTAATNFYINNDGIKVQVPQGTHFFTGTDVAAYNFTMHYDNGTNMDVIQDDGASNPGLDFLFSGAVQFDAPIIANQATQLVGNLSKIRNVPYTWPTVQGVASTVLQNNGSGGLSWSQIPTSTFTAGAVWFKYTFSYSDFATASNQNSVNLVQLPAGGVVQGVKIKQSTAFSGGSISSYTVSVGIPGANDKYASGFDVFQATGPTTYQLTNTFNSEDNDSPAQLTVTATDGGDTLDNASAGTVDVWLLVSVPSGVGYTLNLSTNALNGRMGAFLATANLVGLPKEFARTTIDESPGIKVVRVSISALTAGTGGTSTVFRVSDGSTNLDTSLLTGALNATATFSQNYPTGTILKIIEQSSTNTTKPTGINVMVQYSKQ